MVWRPSWKEISVRKICMSRQLIPYILTYCTRWMLWDVCQKKILCFLFISAFVWYIYSNICSLCLAFISAVRWKSNACLRYQKLHPAAALDSLPNQNATFTLTKTSAENVSFVKDETIGCCFSFCHHFVETNNRRSRPEPQVTKQSDLGTQNEIISYFVWKLS